MAANLGPKIVRTGLILELDAADINSYSGAGATWTDLSGNINNFTLAGSPAFNSANGGSIVFDGANDSATRSLVSSTVTATMDIWFKINAYSQSTLFVNGDSSANGYGFAFGAGGASTSTLYVFFGGINNNVVSFAGLAINTWYNAIYTRTTNSNILYIRGISRSTDVISNPTIPTTITSVGSSAFNGNIAIARIYNRVLSATEVLQNYNAVKSRFGL